MSIGRISTTQGRLTRMGFHDGAAAAEALERLGPDAGEFLYLVAAAADPDLALRYLADLAERMPDPAGFVATLADDEGTAMRLVSVLGASCALGDHLLRHPEHWEGLTDWRLGTTRPSARAIRARLLESVGADPHAERPVATLSDASGENALRVEYRRQLLLLAARDLGHQLALDDVAAELSDLAAGTLDAALAVARARVGAPGEAARLAVIAMGKCGGHELNYVSDVDVIFVVEPAEGHDETAAVRGGAMLASTLMQVCSDHTAEGTIWPVDAALRPEGRSGPLVRTLASHHGYYQRWAKTWEFQALLKARPVAGDLALGADYMALISPMVWSAAQREGFVPEVQAMRQRVIDHIPANQAARQIKLGAGGLRDVEFAVQLLQLVHGRFDESLRGTSTLGALAALKRGGYVGRHDGDHLDVAYRFLRSLEHRMQLFQLRRTHVLPEDEESLRRLGRSLGYPKDSVQTLDREWRKHSREVRRLHEKLFFQPLLETVAKLPTDDVRLSPKAAEQRLAALGYQDPKTALRHLEALTTGLSRTAAIQRTLLPAMLSWFADSPDPDAGLHGFRKVSDMLGATPWYLKTLRDEGQAAQRMALVLGSSRFATDLLERAPEAVAMLGEPRGLVPLDREPLESEMLATASRQEDPVEGIKLVRAIRRRELFRVAVADLLGDLPVETVGESLTAVTSATLQASLALAERSVAAQHGSGALPLRFAIVGMGRYGGHEMGYGSDADVMFVFEPVGDVTLQDAGRMAHDVANEVRRLLSHPGTDPALEVDAGLRPEGKHGPLVRSLESYAGYYAKWSAVWEAQALLRAEAMVGDVDLRRSFTALIDPLRYPEGGLSETDVREIRRIKGRVDNERLPRGADPTTHLKLGRGGLGDIEWTVQLLQLRHGAEVAGLQTTRTLDALDAAGAAGSLEAADVAALAEAWRMVSRIRNAIHQVRGKTGDSLPRDPREKLAVARLLGYLPGDSDTMVNDYLRSTRLARQVVDRIFWD